MCVCAFSWLFVALLQQEAQSITGCSGSLASLPTPINHRATSLHEYNTFELVNQSILLSYYLANKWSLHVRSQDLEIPTIIGENKRN